jgi:hypothetical protein
LVMNTPFINKIYERTFQEKKLHPFIKPTSV